MQIYKFKNQYSIISGVVIAILCFTQVCWSLSPTKSGANTVGFAFAFTATFTMIMDIIKHWNVVYKIDDEKITFIHNNGRSSTTMSWAEVVSMRCYGYSYVPLANVVVIGNEHNKDMMKYTKDVVDTGKNKKNNPTPIKKFQGAAAKKNNRLAPKEYKEMCITAYDNMIQFELISKDDTWDDIVKSGEDEKLMREMICWDNSMYNDMLCSTASKEGNEAIGWEIF